MTKIFGLPDLHTRKWDTESFEVFFLWFFLVFFPTKDTHLFVISHLISFMADQPHSITKSDCLVCNRFSSISGEALYNVRCSSGFAVILLTLFFCYKSICNSVKTE